MLFSFFLVSKFLILGFYVVINGDLVEEGRGGYCSNICNVLGICIEVILFNFNGYV